MAKHSKSEISNAIERALLPGMAYSLVTMTVIDVGADIEIAGKSNEFCDTVMLTELNKELIKKYGIEFMYRLVLSSLEGVDIKSFTSAIELIDKAKKDGMNG